MSLAISVNICARASGQRSLIPEVNRRAEARSAAGALGGAKPENGAQALRNNAAVNSSSERHLVTGRSHLVGEGAVIVSARSGGEKLIKRNVMRAKRGNVSTKSADDIAGDCLRQPEKCGCPQLSSDDSAERQAEVMKHGGCIKCT